ncbi:MAG: PKD domain-containing protein, partial [Aquincola sp.]|nr:PKD domain-containing protein [Aquincola sp.]
MADAGPDQTALIGTTVKLDGSASNDRDGDPLTYSWMLKKRPAGSQAKLIDADTIAPSFVADVPGCYVARLTVSDGRRFSTPSKIFINAVAGNVAPQANAGASQSVLVGATVSLNGSGSSDANSDPLTFAWMLTTRPAGSSATLSDATTVTPSFVADAAGNYVATLVVNDGALNSPPATVTITASIANAPPVANAGPSQNVVVGTTVSLNGGASSDADGDPLTYAWTLTSRPAGSTAALSGAATVTPSFVVDVAGSYVATLIVNDGGFDSAPATVTITVSVANAPPVANAGANQNVLVGDAVVLNGSASSDANGDALTFAWALTSRPAGSNAALAGASTATPTFVPDVAGAYVASLVVNDGQINSAPASVTVSATAGNAPP